MKPSKRKTKNPTQPTPAPEENREFAEFCSVASHELGNLLGVMLGELQVALSEGTGKGSLNVVHRAGEKALAVARNLGYLALHRHLDLEPCDVSQLVLDTVDMVEKELEAHGIHLSVLTESALFGVIDPGALQQIFFNFFAISLRSLPSGGKLSLTLSQRQSSLQILMKIVGPIFREELFHSLIQRTKDEDLQWKGDRLAASVAAFLVEGLGGSLQLRAEESGATLRIDLPFDPKMPRPVSPKDRRRFRRVEAVLPAQIQVSKTTLYAGETRKLSTGGCLLVFPNSSELTLPKVNSLLGLKLFYFENECIEIPKVRVANHCNLGETLGIGLEFGEISPKGKRILAAIVKSHAS